MNNVVVHEFAYVSPDTRRAVAGLLKERAMGLEVTGTIMTAFRPRGEGHDAPSFRVAFAYSDRAPSRLFEARIVDGVLCAKRIA